MRCEELARQVRANFLEIFRIGKVDFLDRLIKNLTFRENLPFSLQVRTYRPSKRLLIHGNRTQSKRGDEISWDQWILESVTSEPSGSHPAPTRTFFLIFTRRLAGTKPS
jgi:hypothetical protein